MRHSVSMSFNHHDDVDRPVDIRCAPTHSNGNIRLVIIVALWRTMVITARCNGLVPIRWQAITLTNAELLSTGPLQYNNSRDCIRKISSRNGGHFVLTSISRVTLYTAGHLHTAVPHCSHSRVPIVHTTVPRENNEHGCVYLRCRAVCKLPGCVEGHPWIC